MVHLLPYLSCGDEEPHAPHAWTSSGPNAMVHCSGVKPEPVESIGHPAPTTIIRPTPTAEWRVEPVNGRRADGTLVVKRHTDAAFGPRVSMLDPDQTIRMTPETARLVAAALLAAADWSDTP
jgi:hypothetical protein